MDAIGAGNPSGQDSADIADSECRANISKFKAISTADVRTTVCAGSFHIADVIDIPDTTDVATPPDPISVLCGGL